MSRKWKITIAVAGVVLAILLFVPVIPAEVPSGTAPVLTSAELQCLNTDRCVGSSANGWGVLSDSSGTYLMFTFYSTACQETACYATTATTLTSFRQLQKDQYSGGFENDPNCTSLIQGSAILVTCPQPRCSLDDLNGEMSCKAITQVPVGSDSMAYRFAQQGPVYFGGEFWWCDRGNTAPSVICHDPLG